MEQHDGYWDVTVIAAGALDESRTFYAEKDVDDFVDKERVKDQQDRLDIPVEIYILFHDHPEYDESDNEYDECGCIQFVRDMRPDYEFGPKWDNWVDA